MLDPFPALSTDRLLLRKVVADDAAMVLKGYSDHRVNQYMSVAYQNLVEVQVQLEWYDELLNKKNGIWWGVCLRENGEMIGNGGFHLWNEKHNSAEIGYWILPEFQKKGFASESVTAMIKFGFDEMHLHRIEAIVESENVISSAMLKSLGFSLDGIRRECERVNGKYINLEIWSLLSSDLKSNR